VESDTGLLINFKPTKGKEIGSAKIKFTTKDVLYSKLRPYLNKVHLPTFDGISATDLIPLRTKEGIEREYLAHYLRTRRIVEYLNSRVHGVQLPRVSIEDIRSTPLPLPPTSEQKIIVSQIERLFTEISVVRNSLHRLTKVMERFRESVLASAFRGMLVSQDGSDELPGDLLESINKYRQIKREKEQKLKAKKGKYFKDEEDEITNEGFPNIPSYWEWTTLESICELDRIITYGVIKLGPDVLEDGVSCLRSSDVRRLSIKLDHVKKISRKIAENYKRTYLKGGEILVTVRGTLGGVAVAPPEVKGYNISREVAIVPIMSKDHAEFIAYWIASIPSQNWLSGVAKGVTYVGINIEDLRRLPVPIPPRKEQQRIVSKIKELYSLAGQMEDCIYKTENRINVLEQSILSRAFHGELVPQDPNDEPASVLLERIQSQKEKR